MKFPPLPVLAVALLLNVTACGSGSYAPSAAAPDALPAPPPVVSDPGPDVLAQAFSYRNLCQAPDPAVPEQRQGSLNDELTWMHAWIEETYLWYREVPAELRMEDYGTPVAYFNALKSPVVTASGRPRDQFHFSYPDEKWKALSQSGVELGYGLSWSRSPGQAHPRHWLVALVEPGSPAQAAGMQRGDRLLAVDGIDFLNASDSAAVDAINAGLFPQHADEHHRLRVARGDSDTTLDLTAAAVAAPPVLNTRTIATASGKVGYLTFNSHNAVAELQLINAIGELKAAGISDLVLDMRYNGGGLVYLASELAYMVAGPGPTAGKVFEKIEYNDRNTAKKSTPFVTSALGLDAAHPAQRGMELPSLGLKRVTILIGSGTCSASESVINGLRGVDVEVELVGDTTCGKPYGFYPTSNCGTTYFAIQFRGVNDKGFGDYADGFEPVCKVADDFTHALGDTGEAVLATALRYRDTKACQAPGAGGQSRAPERMQLVRPPIKEIAIYGTRP